MSSEKDVVVRAIKGDRESFTQLHDRSSHGESQAYDDTLLMLEGD